MEQKRQCAAYGGHCLCSWNMEIGFFIQKAIYVGNTLKHMIIHLQSTLQLLFSWVLALPQAPARKIHQVTTLSIFTDSLFPLLAFGKSVSFERRAPFSLLLLQGTLVMFSNPFLHITSRKMIWNLLKTQQFIHKSRKSYWPPLLPFLPHGFPKAVMHKAVLPPEVGENMWGNKEDNNINQRHTEFIVFLTAMGSYWKVLSRWLI